VSGVENKYDQHQEQEGDQNQQRNKPSTLVYGSSSTLASCNDKEKTSSLMSYSDTREIFC